MSAPLKVFKRPCAARLGRALATACLLVTLGATVSGCVVAPVGGGWCFWHPYRCR